MPPSPPKDIETQLWTISVAVLESWKASHSLVSAQLDSYNFFLHHTLHEIIAEYGAFECVADPSGIRHIIRITNVQLKLPEITEASGQIYPLSPLMCLMRKLDYMAPVLVDISHKVEDPAGKTPNHENIFLEHNLFDLPVMVQSAACRLLEREEFLAQESLYDFGSHFILNGAEKILIAQKKLRVNHLFVHRAKKAAKWVWVGEIRCWTEEKMRSTSTSYFALHEKKGGNGLVQDIRVKMPFLEKYEVPLLLVFRLLGITDPIPFIPSDPAIEGLLRSILADPQGYLTMPMEDIYELVAKKGIKDLSKLKTYEKRQKYVAHIIQNEFLPHEAQHQAMSLGQLVWEFLMTIKGVFKPADRDSYAQKRVYCAGVLMALQVRILLRQYLKSVQLTLQKTIDAGRYTHVIDAMASKKVTMGLKHAISTGQWGIVAKGSGKGGQDGTAQQYTRMNPQASLSQGRRLNTPLNRESKQTKPRQLRPPHYGLVCAAETPEGASCGLIESLAALTHVRLGGSSALVERIVRRILGPDRLLDPAAAPANPGSAFVLFNGTILGRIQDPVEGVGILRRHRQSQDLPFDTSLVWDFSKKRLMICTDVGALLRPFFIVSQLHRLPALFQQYRYEPQFFGILMSEGVIEYLDKEEEELNATVAYSGKTIVPGQTTHVDINPNVIFGFACGTIPFPDHNQAPRNIYGSIQLKQPAGIPFTNLEARMDTSTHMMYYVQRPIVTTLLSSMTCNDELPAGLNVILAIMSDPYCQEDANVISQGFVDRGGMVSTELRTYVGDQMQSHHDREVFCNPSTGKVMLNIQKGNYETLNEQGFAPPGTELPAHEGTAIIGKVMIPLRPEKGSPDTDSGTRDRSLLVHPNTQSFVEKVRVTLGSEGQTIVRVQTRSRRIPEIGDKFAARCGQKNTTGLIRPQEDMPFSEKTGMTPDFIINPHCIVSGVFRVCC